MIIDETEVKNVPYFVQAMQRAEQDAVYSNNFTIEEQVNAETMLALVKAAYIAKEHYLTPRKTQITIKADGAFDVNMKAHDKLKAFAREHGFEYRFLKSSGSPTFFYKLKKKK